MINLVNSHTVKHYAVNKLTTKQHAVNYHTVKLHTVKHIYHKPLCIVKVGREFPKCCCHSVD